MPVVGVDDAVELTGGNLHACVRRADDRVWCWGINELLQVGASVGTVSPTPVEPYGLPSARWVQGAIGGHTCVGPTLFCWGLENRHGELGDGQGRFVTRPIAVTVAPSDTARLYPGAGFTCALTEDGEAACWGRGEHGQLGDGERLSRLTPVSVAAPSSDAASGF